jgi:hypothetical protein
MPTEAAITEPASALATIHRFRRVDSTRRAVGQRGWVPSGLLWVSFMMALLSLSNYAESAGRLCELAVGRL